MKDRRQSGVLCRRTTRAGAGMVGDLARLDAQTARLRGMG
jgi:hypothetical protein